MVSRDIEKSQEKSKQDEIQLSTLYLTFWYMFF